MALVSAGAEVNEPDQIGCTPLHYAAASQAFSRFADTPLLLKPDSRPEKLPNLTGRTLTKGFFTFPRVDRHFSGNPDNNEEEAKESYL